MGNLSRVDWQDIYYDGKYGDEFDFCEDTQTVVKYIRKEPRERYNEDYITDKYSDYSDDYYLKLMRGEIKRL